MSFSANEVKKGMPCIKCDGLRYVIAENPQNKQQYHVRCDLCEGIGKLLYDLCAEKRGEQLEILYTHILTRGKELEESGKTPDEIRNILLAERAI